MPVAKAAKVLTNANMSQTVLKAQYAVRGAIVIRAIELQKQLKANPGSLDFEKVVMCNIGNPQELGQRPPTFARQVLAGCVYPDLLNMNLFPSDVVSRVEEILADTASRSIGAYTHSQGLPVCREKVAKFISDRDGVESNPDDIFLTDGASPGIKYVLQAAIAGPEHGCLVPIPQYPLYSGSVALLNGTMLGYELNEANGWSLDIEEADRVATEAKGKGVTPRVLVVINPGNPTGNTATPETIKDAIELAKKHNLLIMADEVYQENIYDEMRPFHSFRKVMAEMGPGYDQVELASFHSVSKGVFGECGMRGGFMELKNIDPEGKEQLYKLASIGLCSNTPGQVITSVMCNLPKPGEASYKSHTLESTNQFESLKRRAATVSEELNKIEGISTQNVAGAMYCFPQITIPAKAQEKAKERGLAPDAFYALSLLESTGICVVPGSGFGQKDGTFHFRSTILPPEDDIGNVCERLADFHESFTDDYS